MFAVVKKMIKGMIKVESCKLQQLDRFGQFTFQNMHVYKHEPGGIFYILGGMKLFLMPVSGKARIPRIQQYCV